MAAKGKSVPVVLVGDVWEKRDFDLVMRTRVVVGTPWNDEAVRISIDNRIKLWRARLVVWISAYFGVMTTLAAIYAMVTHDRPLVHDIYDLTARAVYAVMVYACGSAVLKVVSGITYRDADHEKKT
jgi:anti-sigma-K factor RskA